MTRTLTHSTFDKERLLQAITGAQASYISEHDTRKVFDNLLIALLNLTDSEYGFIGEVLHSPEGKPYLRTHAISNIAWNDDTRKFYEENAPTGLNFYNLDTLFGHVIDKETVVISNDPLNDPRAGGLPDGHPDLNAFLGLPFFADGKIIGSAGISNRPGGYTQEVVDFLQPFVATCGNILLANRARIEKHRNEQLKNDFVSIISHELRTPMTSIRGALGIIDAMYKDQLSDDIRAIVDTANEGSQRMLRLLNDILDVHKLESGTIEILPGDCNISEVVHKVVRELEPIAEKKNIQLKAEVTDNLKHYADAQRIEQIFVNLVSNALKFTEQGSITLTVTDQGERIFARVEDTGRGIPQEELPFIFDKFHQVGETNTRTTDGIGLGLYIVNNLVSRHQGSIKVGSELGKGTWFDIEFPKSWTTAES